MEGAQYMQRYYSANSTYVNGVLPLNQSPREGTAVYEVAVDDAETTPRSYVLKAKPTAGGSMADDKCGTLVLDSRGRRQIEDGAEGVKASDCWR
ncbi:type IV pilin protein [Eleftheria terrae]|nr:type IV pilin protein [Eleftheria terrae]